MIDQYEYFRENSVPKHAILLILVFCVLFAFAGEVCAAQLVDEEEIYQNGTKEHKTVSTKTNSSPRTTTAPENKVRKDPPASTDSAATNRREKKPVKPQAVERGNVNTTGQQQEGHLTRVRDWISSAYKGPWVRVWNFIFLLIGILVIIRLAAGLAIRLR